MSSKGIGFTLIELLIVIILIAILAVSFSFLFSSSPNLYAQAKLLANDMRYVQSLSMARGIRYRFVKISGTSYTIRDASGNSIAMPNGSTVVSFGNGIQFGSISGFTTALVFDSKGMPYADSSATPLSVAATIQLTKDSDTALVTVDPETGRVSS